MPDFLISVIMPVKNGREYLDECIESIQNQSIDNWELIAVNDGSSDNSRTILDNWAAKDPRIKVIENNGQAIPDALRTGLAVSNGNYISRMDCDDLMHENKLKLLSEALNDVGDKSMSVGLIEYFSDDDLGEGYKNYEAWLNDLITGERCYTEIYRECVIPSCAWMMRKKDLIEDGLFENLEIPEDYDFCFRLYGKKYDLITVPELVHYWRDHKSRTSRNDQRYNIRKFGNFKLKNFIRYDLERDQRIVVWGSGEKGKRMARYLLDTEIPFLWLTSNRKKTGNRLYDKIVYHPDDVRWKTNDRIVIAVSRRGDQVIIGNYLNEKSFEAWHDYFFFF